VQGTPTSSSPSSHQRSAISDRLAQFEKRQSELWRLTFFLLLVVSIVFAVVSWNSIRSFALRFEALPIGLVILVILFGWYTWKRTREISELRGLVRGLEQRDSEPPSDRQLDQLFSVIERSQQGYRDLIDSFDDVLLALTLEGNVRAVNRSFADLVGLPFQQIIGRPLTDFLEEATGDARGLIDRAMPRFLERRHWTGVIQVRLKNQNAIFYYDCVAHAMLRGDQVHGLTVLARDITSSRKNEARFTELFETLQEGIYIVTPDDRILDANPALVRMLGYDSKEQLLTRSLADLLPDPEQRRLLRQEIDTQPMLQGREMTLFRKDGSPIICLNTSAVVRDTMGKVVRYHGALMDITERREMDAPGYAIGGLSVGEPRPLSLEMTEVTAPLLPRHRPRYVMGVGMPEELAEYVARGVDMMDCVLPSRNARNGCLFTSEGRVVIKQARYRDDPAPVDPNCDCYTCRTHSRAYLRHLFQAGEILFSTLATLHNLKHYLDRMRQIRHAILFGTFREHLDSLRRRAAT